MLISEKLCVGKFVKSWPEAKKVPDFRACLLGPRSPAPVLLKSGGKLSTWLPPGGTRIAEERLK